MLRCAQKGPAAAPQLTASAADPARMQPAMLTSTDNAHTSEHSGHLNVSIMVAPTAISLR